MVSLFHLFEFSYPDGMLFFDRSGLIGQRLQAAFPGLLVKSTATDQRDFVLHEKSLDLYYGFSTAHIQSLAPNCSDFPEIAQKFFQIVVSTLEISVIKEFRFRYVVGRPCDSPEQAQQLLLPHIPQETQTQLGKIDFKIQKVLWHASQA
ncbi:MAG TPA: hypothetical protein VMF06_05105, partial [Candidatus Limnocylindria bacterium]|nr:hypothetical protein [Candidatus Limnocylindria bacterium]